MSYQPTDIAIQLASQARDIEFIGAEIRDNHIFELMYEEECREEGLTPDEMYMQLFGEDGDAEIDDMIDRIPVDLNSEMDEVQRILQTDKAKVSIDEIMGIGSDDDDDTIVKELQYALDDPLDD